MTAENKNITVRDLIQVDNELIENISILIKEQAAQSLMNIFADIHHADTAEIINHLNLEKATYVFKILDTETASEVVTQLDDNLREKILKNVDTETITGIVDELDVDDATDIVSDLPEQVAEHVLENIDKEDSEDVKELLKYPEDSAGGIMNSDFVFINKDATVKDAIDEVRRNADEFDQIYHIYVLEDNGILVGTVMLKSLLINNMDTKITSIMEEEMIYVTPDIDQEEVANIIEKYDLVVIPVVDDEKKMLGRITIDDVVDVIQEEAEEDIQKFAGLSEEQETSSSVFWISRIRLPWLIIALIMELLAAVVLSSFEANLEHFITATFFIPVVMAMGGSTGTQAAIVMVRSLGTGEIWLKESIRKLSKEFIVAIINGIACGLLLLFATLLFFPQVTLNFSLLLSISLLVIIILSTMVGAVVPVLFKRFGADPAIATGPFVTTTNDILGLLIYLSFIALFFIS